MLVAKTVLQRRSQQLWFALFGGLIFAAYIVIPVWLTPYSGFGYQFSILRPKDYVFFYGTHPADVVAYYDAGVSFFAFKETGKSIGGGTRWCGCGVCAL